MQSSVAWLVPLLFASIFPVFWAGICFLLAVLSGWRELARTYRGRLTHAEGSVSLASGRMGLTTYRSCLKVSVSGEGLGLSLFPLFAVGAPRLAIPWSAITVSPRDRMLWMDRLRLRIGGVDLALYGTAARLVDEFCARRFPSPETPAVPGFAGR